MSVTLSRTRRRTLYRGDPGMWSWVLHRITGVAIYFFLLVHILDTALVRVSPEAYNEVIETYKMFAYDEGWSRRINEAIDSGLTAEAAIERVQQRTRMRMRQIDDPLLADRMHDLEDLSNRLLRIVSGQMGTAASQGLRSDTILIARNLGPAELLEYDKRRLRGVVLIGRDRAAIAQTELGLQPHLQLRLRYRGPQVGHQPQVVQPCGFLGCAVPGVAQGGTLGTVQRHFSVAQQGIGVHSVL